MANIAIFVSGNGSNCENIIRYFSGNQEISVALVISNKADAYALERAGKYNVPTAVITRAELADESRMIALLRQYGIDYIVLAGFLLMIPQYLIRNFNRRMVNIHPALLPKYGGKGMYGHYIHEAVRAANEKETGITIHYVSEVCDGGEIIFQARVAVSPTDTPDDIQASVHRLEMEYFPSIIEKVIKQ